MANVSQSVDLGLASRPAGYIPPSKFRNPIPVHENAATTLRKQKIEHRTGHLGSLRTNQAVSITTSAYTPLVHKPTNEQIFEERLNLVGHWFDLWSVKQRKKFIFEMFQHCGQPEMDFVQLYSDSTLVVKRKDFTSVLPAFISKYIFSFLDPKSLSRSAQVSTHWRFLSESDEIWISKCIKHGWYLQYQPSQLENGAWKRHYVKSIENLVPGKERMDEFGEKILDGFGTDRSDLFMSARNLYQISTPRTPTPRSKSPLSRSSSRTLALEDRPRWQDTDKKPKELEWSNYQSLISPDNPHNPKSPKSAYLHENRWGVNSFFSTHSYGLGSTERTDKHPLKQEQFQEMTEVETRSTGTLSELLHAERVAEGSDQLKETPLYFPQKQAYENRFGRFDVSDNKDYRARDLRDLSANYPTHSHPRVIFISSRLPAKEILQDSVMYGVIAIVYEYEGTTLDTLIALLNNVLKSRQAQSIGFLTDGNPGEIWLTQDATVAADNLENKDIKDFWLAVAMNTIPPGTGGHIDIFTPLASCDSGMELLFQLKVLTGLKFTSPINMIGGIRSVVGDWLEKPEDMKPVNHYFKFQKIVTWIAIASRMKDALFQTEQFLGHYFSTKRRGIVNEMVGKMVFDAIDLGMLKTMLSDIVPVIIEGLVEFKSEKEKQPPLQFLSDYLAKRQKAIASGEDAPRPKTEKDEQDEITDLMCLRKYERERALKRVKNRENIENQPDRRATAAVELLSSEVDYMRSLTCMIDVFMKPLKQTLDASKPIIGIGNIHALFTDISAILDVSRGLVKEITEKIESWNNESTLADIMIKFSGKSKAYTNYINNYPIVMRTYDMLIETNPAFRAFIAENEESIRTKMLTFHELYMLPTKRISEYILILQSLQINTPPNHPDKTDIPQAIVKLEALNQFIYRYKTKLIRDKQICDIEKRIINCPQLLEGNRHFLREDYASLVKIRSDGETYSHIQDLIIFLFSDSLLICILKTKHEPFEHILNRKIIFSTCIALSKVKVRVIRDTKFVQHAIELSTKKSSWIFKLPSYKERIAFVHTIETALRALVAND